MYRITINGQDFEVAKGKSVLQAALDLGVYIPHLCFHPGIKDFDKPDPRPHIYRASAIPIENDMGKSGAGCGLCIVMIEGRLQLQKACVVNVEDGMVIHTDHEAVNALRVENFAAIMETNQHPTACVTCKLSEGCDRKICSMNAAEQERCCWKFHNCELREIAAYIGVQEGPRQKRSPPLVIDDNPVFKIDYSLCINCMRCVQVCKNIAKREVFGFVYHGAKVLVGTVLPDLRASGCKYCLACADVCPTGAIRDKKYRKNISKERKTLAPSILPPRQRDWIILSAENLSRVPDAEGVYRLYDHHQDVIQITGTSDLKGDLGRELNNSDEQLYFAIDIEPMFMMRERQLIQQYMEKHGDLPQRNKALDDLF